MVVWGAEGLVGAAGAGVDVRVGVDAGVGATEESVGTRPGGMSGGARIPGRLTIRASRAPGGQL